MRLSVSTEVSTSTVTHCDLCEKELLPVDVKVSIPPGIVLEWFDLCGKCANKIPFALREHWEKAAMRSDDTCEEPKEGLSLIPAITALNKAGFDVTEYNLDKWTKEFRLVIKARARRVKA